MHQLVDRFAEDNHISHAKAYQTLGATYFDGHVSGTFSLKDQLGGKVWDWLTGSNISASGSIGHRHDWTHSHSDQSSKLFNKAETFSKDHDFSHTVDHALRAVEDSQFRVGSDVMDRQAHSMASHFEQGDRYSHDAVSSFDQSQSYRHQESVISDNSLSINNQAQQEFTDWLSQQPAPFNDGGKMNASTMSYVMTHDPQLRQTYADQFVQTKTQSYMEQFQQHNEVASLKTEFDQHNTSIGSQQQVSQQDAIDQSMIKKTAKQMDLGQVQDHVSSSAKQVVQQAEQDAIDRTTGDGRVIQQQVTQQQRKD